MDDALDLIHAYIRDFGPLKFSHAGDCLDDFEKAGFWTNDQRIVFFPRTNSTRDINEFVSLGPWHDSRSSWYLEKGEMLGGPRKFFDTAKLRRKMALVDLLAHLEEAFPSPSDELVLGVIKGTYLAESPRIHPDIPSRYGAEVVLHWQMVPVASLATA